MGNLTSKGIEREREGEPDTERADRQLNGGSVGLPNNDTTAKHN